VTPSAFRRFRADTSGNVAIILGIAAIPLLAAAGLALDYSYAARERTDLQNAVDAAAISLAKLPQNTSQADLETKAEAFVAAYMPNSAANDFKVEVVPSKGRIEVTASANYPTSLVKVLDLLSADERHSNMEIGASATASWGNGKVEVVLVLDNTGSMDEGKPKKIEMLRSAVTSLVDTLATQATETDTVKIALVPFSSTVRLPTATTDYKTKSWIDKDGRSPIAKEIFKNTENVKRFDLFKALDDSSSLDLSWKGCVESRPTPYDVEDPAPSAGTPGTLIVPFFAPDEPDDTKNGSPVYDNSYLGDNTSSSDFQTKQGNIGKYGALKSKNFDGKGPNKGCDLLPIVPLTTDLSTNGPIRIALKNMVATGYTNIPMGLAWGWYAVSPNDMLSDNKLYSDEDTAKVIVLLSDGKNQFEGASSSDDKNNSVYSGVGYVWQNRLGTTSIGSMTGKANDRLKTLCTNINALRKKSGSTARAIDLYTVLVEESDSATSTLMKNCASEPGMYFNVADSANLISVFNSIAGSISKLHLSK
jgi:Flp pilus assembly protein TadG